MPNTWLRAGRAECRWEVLFWIWTKKNYVWEVIVVCHLVSVCICIFTKENMNIALFPENQEQVVYQYVCLVGFWLASCTMAVVVLSLSCCYFYRKWQDSSRKSLWHHPLAMLVIQQQVIQKQSGVFYRDVFSFIPSCCHTWQRKLISFNFCCKTIGLSQPSSPLWQWQTRLLLSAKRLNYLNRPLLISHSSTAIFVMAWC